MLKSTVWSLVGLLLVLALAIPVLAQPAEEQDSQDDYSYDDYRSSRPPLTPGQLETWNKLWTAYQDKLYPIRSQLADQRLLYRILANQTSVNLDEVKKCIAEMAKFRDQIRAERQKFLADLKTSGLPEDLGVHADSENWMDGGWGGHRGRHGGGWGHRGGGWGHDRDCRD
ncbi:MAG: periplasmic heavy metal sensor [Deltaproteobacteria bacterium]|jgi:hypothetical protein|nr:periplasmic heavy metal sensor [Deltaproteobacteria bacterium]